jgi:adenosylcobinamide-GDP ribazoletransferase
MRWLMYQWQLFMLAVSFFSRLPIPQSTPYSSERLAKSNRYFGLVGLLLGILTSIAYYLISTVAPSSVAVLIAMIVSLILTGAFHEDGLADTADGLGGGMSIERKLEIMKDSRIGTYGTSALICSLGLKYVLLVELAQLSALIPIIIASYTVSRVVAASLIFNTAYVTSSDASKSKPIASNQSLGELSFLIMCGLATMLFIFDFRVVLLLVPVCVVLQILLRHYFISSINGITGDCLGAVQQIIELCFYFVVLTLLFSGYKVFL